MVISAMNVKLWAETLSFTSVCAPQFIDITDHIEQCLKEAGIRQGLAVVYSKHTTAAIKINEHEPELLKDMEAFLRRLAPSEASYFHNNFFVRTVNVEEDECPNGHAHCQHLLLNTSETIPVVEGRLALGLYQRVFLVELDRPRTREVVVQLMGA